MKKKYFTHFQLAVTKNTVESLIRELDLLKVDNTVAKNEVRKSLLVVWHYLINRLEQRKRR